MKECLLKNKKNRDIIRHAAVNRAWPQNLLTTARKKTDPEFQMGPKRKRNYKNDEGMDKKKVFTKKLPVLFTKTRND